MTARAARRVFFAEALAVCHVLKTSAPHQIFNPIVLGVAVKMSALLTFSPRPVERRQYQSMNELWVALPQHYEQMASLVRARLQNAPLKIIDTDCAPSVELRNLPIQTSNAPMI